jgi:hypothetical protein
MKIPSCTFGIITRNLEWRLKNRPISTILRLFRDFLDFQRKKDLIS